MNKLLQEALLHITADLFAGSVVLQEAPRDQIAHLFESCPPFRVVQRLAAELTRLGVTVPADFVVPPKPAPAAQPPKYLRQYLAISALRECAASTSPS